MLSKLVPEVSARSRSRSPTNGQREEEGVENDNSRDAIGSKRSRLEHQEMTETSSLLTRLQQLLQDGFCTGVGGLEIIASDQIL